MDNQSPTPPIANNPPGQTTNSPAILPPSDPRSSFSNPDKPSSKFRLKIIALAIIFLLFTGGLTIYFLNNSSKTNNSNLSLPDMKQSQPQEIEKNNVYPGIKKRLIETLE